MLLRRVDTEEQVLTLRRLLPVLLLGLRVSRVTSASTGCCGRDGGLGLESAAAASHFQLFVLLLTYEGWRWMSKKPSPGNPHSLWRYSLPSRSQPFWWSSSYCQSHSPARAWGKDCQTQVLLLLRRTNCGSSRHQNISDYLSHQHKIACDPLYV